MTDNLATPAPPQQQRQQQQQRNDVPMSDAARRMAELRERVRKREATGADDHALDGDAGGRDDHALPGDGGRPRGGDAAACDARGPQPGKRLCRTAVVAASRATGDDDYADREGVGATSSGTSSLAGGGGAVAISPSTSSASSSSAVAACPAGQLSLGDSSGHRRLGMVTRSANEEGCENEQLPSPPHKRARFGGCEGCKTAPCAQGDCLAGASAAATVETPQPRELANDDLEVLSPTSTDISGQSHGTIIARQLYAVRDTGDNSGRNVRRRIWHKRAG